MVERLHSFIYDSSPDKAMNGVIYHILPAATTLIDTIFKKKKMKLIQLKHLHHHHLLAVCSF